jgi:hypothetical protein
MKIFIDLEINHFFFENIFNKIVLTKKCKKEYCFRKNDYEWIDVHSSRNR